MAYRMAYHENRAKHDGRSTAMALTKTARDTIKWWYSGDDDRIRVTIAGYIRRHSDDNRWHGDDCGCTDDRCIGYHHDDADECQCLPALLDQWVVEQRARLAAAPIWSAYRAAVESNDGRGDEAAYEAAWASAEEWVRTYHPGAQTFSLDALIDGRVGISITTRWNDRDWLVWTPEQAAA